MRIWGVTGSSLPPVNRGQRNNLHECVNNREGKEEEEGEDDDDGGGNGDDRGNREGGWWRFILSNVKFHAATPRFGPSAFN